MADETKPALFPWQEALVQRILAGEQIHLTGGRAHTRVPREAQRRADAFLRALGYEVTEGDGFTAYTAPDPRSSA